MLDQVNEILEEVLLPMQNVLKNLLCASLTAIPETLERGLKGNLNAGSVVPPTSTASHWR